MLASINQLLGTTTSQEFRIESRNFISILKSTDPMNYAQQLYLGAHKAVPMHLGPLFYV